MKATHLRIGSMLTPVLAMALLTGAAQEIPGSANQAGIGQLAGERDKAQEDKVAKLFERIRVDSTIPHLKRIKHRKSLEQKVCTIALTGEPPKHLSTNVFGFYMTSNPDSVTPELSKVAAFNDLHPKYNPSYARYSVAVWPVKDPKTAGPMYWVGVQIFWGAGMEFLDSYFTDDIYYHNEWKKTIAPPCRNK